MLIAGPVGFYVRRRRGHRLAPRLRLWVHRTRPQSGHVICLRRSSCWHRTSTAARALFANAIVPRAPEPTISMATIRSSAAPSLSPNAGLARRRAEPERYLCMRLRLLLLSAGRSVRVSRRMRSSVWLAITADPGERLVADALVRLTAP
jgi:hypothetical protein